MRGGAGRQLIAVHQREIHAGLFEHRAVAQHARAPATAAGARPGIFDKLRFAIDLFDGLADAILQRAQKLLGFVQLARCFIILSANVVYG